MYVQIIALTVIGVAILFVCVCACTCGAREASIPIAMADRIEGSLDSDVTVYDIETEE